MQLTVVKSSYELTWFKVENTARLPPTPSAHWYCKSFREDVYLISSVKALSGSFFTGNLHIHFIHFSPHPTRSISIQRAMENFFFPRKSSASVGADSVLRQTERFVNTFFVCGGVQKSTENCFPNGIGCLPPTTPPTHSLACLLTRASSKNPNTIWCTSSLKWKCDKIKFSRKACACSRTSSSTTTKSYHKYVIIVHNIISICILWRKIIFRLCGMNSMGNKGTFNNKVNYVPYDEREHTEARREAGRQQDESWSRRKFPPNSRLICIALFRVSASEALAMLAELIGLLNYLQGCWCSDEASSILVVFAMMSAKSENTINKRRASWTALEPAAFQNNYGRNCERSVLWCRLSVSPQLQIKFRNLIKSLS